MKAVVAAFNQEKALVRAFSVITNLRMQLFGALNFTPLLIVLFSHFPIYHHHPYLEVSLSGGLGTLLVNKLLGGGGGLHSPHLQCSE